MTSDFLLKTMNVNNETITIKSFLESFSKNNSEAAYCLSSFNLNDDKSVTLPVIIVSFGNFSCKFLLDSGSSISLVSSNIFNEVKSNTKVKFLSRRVNIRTVNSTLTFSACTEISMKINKNNFKQVFYVSDFSQHQFDGLLGFDFISKYNVILDPSQNKAIFQNFEIPFFSENHKCLLNAIESIDYPASLVNKVILEPGDTTQVTLKFENNVVDNQTILFEPTLNVYNCEIHPSLNLTTNSTITTVIKNLSNETLHLNKNQVIGNIVTEFTFDDDNNNVDQAVSQTDDDLLCNLISASDDILVARKNELQQNDFDLSHLDQSQKQEMLNILMPRYAAFSKTLKTLGCTDRVTPNITLRSNNPIRTLPFEIPHSLKHIVERELDELVEAGLIHRNIAEWACPMLLVKKKPDPKNPDQPQKFRLALDLRLLNSIIEHSTYPLPKISSLINDISSYQYYTLLDLKNAYWQIKLPEHLQDILTFTTPFGTFANRRLVFGLKTAASTFQLLIDLIIDELKLNGVKGIYSFQDDVCICSDDFNSMCFKIQSILDVLIKYNITLSPSKCVFFKNNIDYLGFHITHQHISPITSNISKITSFQPPKTVKQVKKFLGICGFYRHLIPKYAELTETLTQLTRKNVKFSWTPNHQKAFEQLQEIFFTSPFVVLPNWEEPFVLNTDASGCAVSAVLMQERQGSLHPISYFSKTLTPAEQKYPAIKLELYAIYKGVTSFKSYLYNRKFKILTDSKPLLHFQQSSSPANNVTRWLLELSEYTFTFQHIPGKINMLADYLSRMQNPNNHVSLLNSNVDDHELILPFLDSNPLNEQTNVIIDTDIVEQNTEQNNSTCHDLVNENCELINIVNENDPVNEVSSKTFLIEQSKDENIQELVNILKSPSLIKAHKVKNFFIDKNTGLLMHRSPKLKIETIVVPHTLKSKILNICHLSHNGIAKTYEIVTNRYFWIGMYQDTKNYVLSCDQCIKFKSFTPKQAPLKSIPIPKRPSEFISIDILGPIKNCGHILTVLDHFSKHLVLYPLNNLTTETMSKHLINYMSHYGRPAVVLSDQGTQFTSEVFDILNQAFGIKLIHCSKQRPETNGQSERINAAIKSSVLALHEKGISFQNSLLIHQQLYNGVVHSSTGYTPNILHFGRNLSLIFDTFNPEIAVVNLDKSYYIKNLLTELTTIYENAYDSMTRMQVRQNARHNSNAKLRSLKVNDIVYVKSRDTFKPKYTGPFVIVEKCNDLNYIIKHLDDSNPVLLKYHLNRLRLAPNRYPHLLYDNQPNLSVPVQNTYNLRSRN